MFSLLYHSSTFARACRIRYPYPLSYTWRHPCGTKKLVWAISGYEEEFQNELKSDNFKIIQLEDDKLVGWVSFLDGMQRILLFTEDVNLCYKVSVTIHFITL